MKTLTSITGREFEIISSNKTMRTITFRVGGTKYRTIQMSKDEFQSAQYWTGNDWSQFMKSDEYYKLRK